MNRVSNISRRLIRKLFLINHAIKLCKLGSKGNISKFLFLILFSLIEGISDTLPILIIIPFLILLSNPEKIWEFDQIKNIANYFGLESSSALLIPSLIVFIVVIAANIFLKLFTIKFSNYVKASVGHQISKIAYEKVLYSNYEFQFSTSSSKIINDFNACIRTSIAYLDSFLDSIRSLFSLFFITITLFLVNKYITILIVISTSFTYIILAISKNKTLAKKGRIIKTTLKKQVDVVQEAWGSKKNIILESNQKIFLDKFSFYNQRNLFAGAKITTAVTRPKFIIEGTFVLIIGTAAYLLKYLFDMDPIPILGSVTYGLQKLLPSVYGIFQIYSSMRARYEISISIEKLITDTPQDIRKEIIEKQNLEKLNFKQLELKNVFYHYPSNEKYIINGLNLKISKGETIGIVGTTGSGKSTLINLIMGLMKPTKGNLFVNGLNISDNNNQDNLIKYRRSISHVPQSIFLNNISILENIAFGEKLVNIEHERVIKACKAANIFHFIASSPKGLNTIVGERGINLSGGQLQRIALARALYRDSEILILDEATSALDTNTEKEVIKSLRKYYGKLTIISIAHRISTLYGYDKIFSVNNGEIHNVTDSVNKKYTP